MNIEELNSILARGESQQLEFKESFRRETSETVAAFCNVSGGTILVGIDKNGRIKGVSVNDEILKEWVNTIKQDTQPQIFPEINTYVVESKTIAVVKVQEYPIKPVSCKGKYYKRVGASNHLVPLVEIVEMQLYSINSSFDSFNVQRTPGDLNMDLVVNFFGQLGNAGRITLHEDPMVNLKKIGLIRADQLTFAALLLFGEHQSGIHIGRFKTPDVIIDDIMIKSPLVTAVDEAMTFIKKSISLRYDFTGELRRKETWQYPLPVIRELLMNAVIHKDYRNPTDIMIKIFDDHIRFINPGSLMGGLVPDDLMKGNYVAVHRNKLLAEAFYLRGDIEKFGTGFYRIQSELKNSPELRFTLESLNGFVRSGLEATPQDTTQDKTLEYSAIDKINTNNNENTTQDTPQDKPLKYSVIEQDSLGDNRITHQDTPQDGVRVDVLVDNLVAILTGELTRIEIQGLLSLKDRENFRIFYLKPALEAGLIEMTISGKPNSKYQKYRLTEKGKRMKLLIKKNNQ